VDKEGNLENGVRIQMNEFNLVVTKESAEKVTGRKAKSTLEERRKHHNLGGIGCRNIFSSNGTPLEHGTIREEMIRDQFADLTLSRG
jgi:hypothetical protein